MCRVSEITFHYILILLLRSTPIRNARAGELEAVAKENAGKEVRILLPLEIQNTVNEYIFTFKVEDFTPFE